MSQVRHSECLLQNAETVSLLHLVRRADLSFAVCACFEQMQIMIQICDFDIYKYGSVKVNFHPDSISLIRWRFIVLISMLRGQQERRSMRRRSSWLSSWHTY